jgi:hypothetical protein
MADDVKKPAESIEDITQMVVGRMVKLTGSLAAMKVDDDHDWFRTMLLGILKSTHRNYLAVQGGTPNTPDFACWGARNLLELRIITAYVLRSLDNAVDFMDDLAADTREMWENITKAAEFTHRELVAEMRAVAIRDPDWGPFFLSKADEEERKGPSTLGPATELENTRKMMVVFGVDPMRRPKQGSKIAALVEESERYAPRFKVLSKIVHPTALSIAALNVKGSLDELMPLINNQAVSDMLWIYYAIEEHVAAHGMSWQDEATSEP